MIQAAIAIQRAVDWEFVLDVAPSPLPHALHNRFRRMKPLVLVAERLLPLRDRTRRRTGSA